MGERGMKRRGETGIEPLAVGDVRGQRDERVDRVAVSEFHERRGAWRGREMVKGRVKSATLIEVGPIPIGGREKFKTGERRRCVWLKCVACV